MPSDNEPRKPLTVPPFSSKLPETLLGDLNPRDREFYRSIDEMKQAVQWVAVVAATTANRLEDVHDQTVRTNGRVTSAESDIREIKTDQTEIKKQVQTVKAVKRVVKSKYFWAAAALFFFVVLPWTAAHVPASKVWETLVTLVGG